jgi:hypothetical protein
MKIWQDSWKDNDGRSRMEVDVNHVMGGEEIVEGYTTLANGYSRGSRV